MRYLTNLLVVILFVGCSSDAIESEPEMKQQLEEDVAQEAEEKNQQLFSQLTIFSYQPNDTGEESFWYKIMLSDDLQSDILNISETYNLNSNATVVQQSKSEVMFSYLSSSVSDANGGYIRKHVSFDVDKNIEIEFENLLSKVNAIYDSFELQLISNTNNFYGLYRETSILEGNEIEKYFIAQINKESNMQETLWSYEDVLLTDLEIDLGFGFQNTGISANDDYLFLAYSAYDYDTVGSIEEKNTYYVQVFNTFSKEVIRTFNSDNPIGLLQSDNFICLSIDGELELYDLNTNQSKRIEGSKIYFDGPGYGFVNNSKFIFGASSGAPGIGIQLLAFLDFDTAQMQSIVLSDLLKANLDHIPSNVFIKGETYSVDFEKELILWAYSYEVEGDTKYELIFLDLDGEVLDYIELPNEFAPRIILIN